MANRYWVPGGTGNWNSTTNWAATSGGASGASFPVTTDSVFVDALSGTSPVITVNANSNCIDLDFTGAITPTFAGGQALIMSGSLTRIAAMTWTFNGLLTFSSASTGKTVTSAGGSYPGSITFSGSGGGWILQDDLVGTSTDLTITVGTLDTNGKNVTISGNFNMSNTNTRGFTLGASIMTVSGTWTATTTTGLTFSAGTSTIIMAGTTRTFNGGGLTYYNLTVSGTPITIAGSNTFSTLTLNAGKTLNLTSGTTQTVTTFLCNGKTASPSSLQAVTAGTPGTIALPAGRYFIRHTSIKDITISGATAVTSIAGTNVSGNTGITFVTKFEIGRIKNDGSFNWYSTATGSGAKVSG